METQNENLNTESKSSVVGIIHVLLLLSYAVYFLGVILGVIFDQIIPINIFSKHTNLSQYIGIIMIFFGSILVYWAQHTTHVSKKHEEKERGTNFFIRGPYKYTRNPTNFGVFIITIGLGFLINSFFSIIFILLTYLISRIFFIKKQDSILEERYGDAFLEYKKKVKNIL